MANAFVEYFNNIGRIFTEKNAWYRIFTFCVILGIYQFSLISVRQTLKNSLNGIPASLNIPLLILMLLCAVLVFGYRLLIFSNRMNKQDNLVPKIDFLQMFTVGLKSIPFYIVWAIYYMILSLVLGIVVGIFIVLLVLLLFAMHLSQNVTFVLLMIILTPIAMLIVGPWFGVVAVFSKDFSYKKALNPSLYFRLLPKIATKILGAFLGNIIPILVLLILGVKFYQPVSMMYLSLQPEMQFTSLIAIVLLLSYIVQIFQFAFNCTVADITSEAIKDGADTPDDNIRTNNTVVDIEYENKDE